MFSSIRVGRISLILAAVVVSRASAQGDQMQFGGRIDYHAKEHQFGVGAQFSAPVLNRVDIYPSASMYSLDGQWLYNASFDLKYAIPNQPLGLYTGAGFGVQNAGGRGFTSSHAGANVFAGFEPPTGSLKTFAEIRVMFGRTDSHVGLAMGVNYNVGRVKR